MSISSSSSSKPARTGQPEFVVVTDVLDTAEWARVEAVGIVRFGRCVARVVVMVVVVDTRMARGDRGNDAAGDDREQHTAQDETAHTDTRRVVVKYCSLGWVRPGK